MGINSLTTWMISSIPMISRTIVAKDHILLPIIKIMNVTTQIGDSSMRGIEVTTRGIHCNNNIEIATIAIRTTNQIGITPRWTVIQDITMIIFTIRIFPTMTEVGRISSSSSSITMTEVLAVVMMISHHHHHNSRMEMVAMTREAIRIVIMTKVDTCTIEAVITMDIKAILLLLILTVDIIVIRMIEMDIIIMTETIILVMVEGIIILIGILLMIESAEGTMIIQGIRWSSKGIRIAAVILMTGITIDIQMTGMISLQDLVMVVASRTMDLDRRIHSRIGEY